MSPTGSEPESVKQAVRRLQKWAAHHLPRVTFRPGLGKRAIRAVAGRMGVDLPAEVVELFTTCDGTEECDGLLGNWDLLQLDHVERNWQLHKELFVDGALNAWGKGVPARAVKGDWWNVRWLPFASSGSGHFYCIDLDPLSAGTVGQVILFLHDEAERYLVAPSLGAWLSRLADDLDTGVQRLLEADGDESRFENEGFVWSSQYGRDLYGSPPRVTKKRAP